MYATHIVCVKCKKEYPLENIHFCECGGPLEIRYDLDGVNLTKDKLKRRHFSHWKYAELFPTKKRVSMGEGGTRLIKSRELGKRFRLGELYIKEELSNPSGSFKDRGSTVEVSQAIAERAKKLCVASTGNMGASCSAYSALAGLPIYVFAPRYISHCVRVQMSVCGSRLIEVEGDYDECAELARVASKKYGLYLMGDYAYRKEGEKSVAFEILEQLNFESPDCILSPVGNGTLISAVWKGIKEFHELGLIEKKPKLIGVQAKGASPVYNGFEGKIIPEKPKTIAHAIAVGNPTDGISAIKAIKESKGKIMQISDERMLGAQKLLARKEGLFVQPAAAISIAALHDLDLEDERVVCIATGHGLKRPEAVRVRASFLIKKERELKNIFG